MEWFEVQDLLVSRRTTKDWLMAVLGHVISKAKVQSSRQYQGTLLLTMYKEEGLSTQLLTDFCMDNVD